MRRTVGRPAVLVLGLALAAGSLVAGASTSATAAPPTGLRVVGNQLTRGGQPFLVRGFNLVGAMAGTDCTQTDIVKAAAHLGQPEMAALAGTWHANTVRLQVLQTALTDPVPSNVTTYLASLTQAVAVAHAAGLAVILSMQDQYQAGCGDQHPMPSQNTVTAWTTLVPLFAGDGDVAFELYNEPHDGPANPVSGTLPGPGQWDEWLNGGSSPEPNLGDPAVGHQQLVDDIRALGATNVLIADGLNRGGQLQGVPLLQDTLATPNIAYGIHPYYYVLGSSDWTFRFGDAANQVPVIATEWNYPTSKCGAGSLPQSMAPAFLSYLATRGIGVLGQSADIGIGTLLMADWTWAPTDCGTPSSGPGVDFAAAMAAAQAPRATQVTLTASTGQTVGQPSTLAGTLTVDDQLAPGVPLALTRRNPDGTSTSLPSVTTNLIGGFQLSDVPVAVGTTTYTVTYAGNPATAAATASALVTTIPVLTFLSATGPPSAARGVPLTITGTLTGGDTATGLRPLTWTRTDIDGTVPLAPLTTDSAGGFVATDSPPAGGTVTYTFRFAGDSTHSGSTTTVTVAVDRITPALTVTVNGRVFAYGGAGTVTVHLGPTYTNRTISLYEYVYGVPVPAWTLVHTGPVNSAGNYLLSTAFYRHVAFQASFAGDARYASATYATSTTALARVTTSVAGSYGTSGSYRLFHSATNPAFRAVLAPARGAVGCVTFTAQSFSGGAWRTVATTACVPVDATSGATGLPLAKHSLSVQYRVRASIATDAVNAATTGAWVYVEFRT